MKGFIVLCIVIVPILGRMFQPTDLESPVIDNAPPRLRPRVVNGKFASNTQFPWQVSIQPLNSDGVPLVRCSGSLISSNRILTVAHCIRDYEIFKLGLGSTNINTPKIEQIVGRTNIVIHPRFNNVSLNHDIAIIRLTYDVQMGETVTTVRLPSRVQTELDYFANKVASVSGWGRTNDVSNTLSDLLQFANINVTTNAYCKSMYGGDIILNSSVCGLGIPVTSSPCGGDSGSPLVLTETNGAPMQIGMFSFVAGLGCSNGYPAGYTYVAPYLDWISRNTGIPIID